jgi:hypothetical protein
MVCGCLVCCSHETTLTFHLFVSFVRCKKRHAPSHVAIVASLVVGTLAAASTTKSAASTSRDGLRKAPLDRQLYGEYNFSRGTQHSVQP